MLTRLAWACQIHRWPVTPSGHRIGARSIADALVHASHGYTLENLGGKAKKRGVKLIDKSVIIRDESVPVTDANQWIVKESVL